MLMQLINQQKLVHDKWWRKKLKGSNAAFLSIQYRTIQGYEKGETCVKTDRHRQQLIAINS